MACPEFDLICPAWGTESENKSGIRKGEGWGWWVPLWSSWRYRDSDWAKLTIPHFGVPTGKDTGKFWQWHKRDLPKVFYCKEVTAMNGDRAWMSSLKVMCMPCYWPLWAQHGGQAGWQSIFFSKEVFILLGGQGIFKVTPTRTSSITIIVPMWWARIFEKPVAECRPPVKGDKSNCVYCASFHGLFQVP